MIFGQINISKMSAQSEVALQNFICQQGISLMAIQKTGNWIPTDEFFVDKKVIHKTDTNLAGVAIVADKVLCPEHVDTIEDESLDAVWCQLHLNNQKVLVGSVYSRPTKDTDGLKKLLDQMFKCIVSKIRLIP